MLDDIIRDIIVPAGKPVLANMAIGHMDTKMTVPLGVNCVLDATAGSYEVPRLCVTYCGFEPYRADGNADGQLSLLDHADQTAAEAMAERLSLAAALACLREAMTEKLEALGMKVIPGEANFLLFQCERPLVEPLKKRGILIRCCGDFHGLDESWYRAAVRTREDNDRLVAALKEILT